MLLFSDNQDIVLWRVATRGTSMPRYNQLIGWWDLVLHLFVKKSASGSMLHSVRISDIVISCSHTNDKFTSEVILLRRSTPKRLSASKMLTRYPSDEQAAGILTFLLY